MLEDKRKKIATGQNDANSQYETFGSTFRHAVLLNQAGLAKTFDDAVSVRRIFIG